MPIIISLDGNIGSGKSTLIKCVNGLEKIDSGCITINGQVLGANGTDISLLRAQVGMVFQNFNLFPHMTAFENTMLAPKRVQGLSKSQLKSEIEELFERF